MIEDLHKVRLKLRHEHEELLRMRDGVKSEGAVEARLKLVKNHDSLHMNSNHEGSWGLESSGNNDFACVRPSSSVCEGHVFFALHHPVLLVKIPMKPNFFSGSLLVEEFSFSCGPGFITSR